MKQTSSVAKHHAEWLSLIEVNGPFLTLPVLKRALPHGLEPTDPAVVDELRQALKELEDDPSLQPRWVDWVITRLLGFPTEVLRTGAAIGPSVTHRVAEHGEVLRPDYAIVEDVDDHESPRLLASVWQPEADLTERPPGARWAASPIERLAELCRATDCRLGLVTNGDTWVLLDAPLEGAMATATWDAVLWIEERTTLDAFVTLLGVRRFFSVAEPDTLEALLAESATAEAEVTDQLGKQVRAAVELFVEATSRANRDRGGAVFAQLDQADLDVDVEPYVYEAAVTVLMRLVFLLSAEERGLFLLGDPSYDTTYAVSTLLGQLEEDANRHGEDVLERRTDAWHRLLATFRMVHAGAAHENLRLPPYGGGLFDPDRFPFLEGREPGSRGELGASSPLPIDNRTIKHILDALQILRFRGGGWTEARRLSFRALDVEQIGHVYEGLLDHSVVRATAVGVGLNGKLEPELALSEIEDKAASSRATFVAWFVERTGLSAKAVERALDSEPDPDDLDRLVSACDNDRELAGRIAPYFGLLRRDLRGLPVVYLPDSFYVTQSSERRSSGTYYTPRALAEEMVTHTLEPLVYAPGPAEGVDPVPENLKSSVELLELRVCDMAMGSGAFLVAACRYLSERMLEAWDAEDIKPGDSITLLGGTEIPMPDNETDRELLARRLAADRCLYGVDRNPMAVEMAKLSLWLITLAKDRPFSFIDHALQCGDSLLGINDLSQLHSFHLDSVKGRELHGGSLFDPGTLIEPLVKAALEKRRQLESFPVVDVQDAERKRKLLEESNALLDDLKVIGDLVVGAALSTATQKDDAYDTRLLSVAAEVAAALDSDRSDDDRAARLYDLRLKAAYWLDEGRPPLTPERRCFHWVLEFPEVFLDLTARGFDAIVGNPPFIGGQKITGELGTDYRHHLIAWTAAGAKGSADLVAYFFLRASRLARSFGYLATNTIGQGDTSEVGLTQIIDNGWTIHRAVSSTTWPGDASLEIAKVWTIARPWRGGNVLDGRTVVGIDEMLYPKSRSGWRKQRLVENAGQSFQGSNVLGRGFTMSPDEANTLIDKDPHNSDVLFPYLGGEDLNDSPNQQAPRWVINFFDWPERKARTYPDCYAIVKEKVKPERAKNKDQRRREIWWQFTRPTVDLYQAIEPLDRTMVISLTSKVVQPVFVPTGQVFSHSLGVFAYEDDFHFGVLTSGFHYRWAVRYASTLETRIRYTPSDVFETFPQPQYNAAVEAAGRELNEHRAALMIENDEGLTKTYNRVHDPDDHAPGIVKLRERHVTLDYAVRDAYGWSDLDLGHGFYDVRGQGGRFTFSPEAADEVLDRLLELNKERYEDEVRRGLHRKSKVRKPSARTLKAAGPAKSERLF